MGEREEVWVKTSSALSFFCHNNRDCSFRELGFGSRERVGRSVDLVLVCGPRF